MIRAEIEKDSGVKLEPLSIKRKWMDNVTDAHAYNCFPIETPLIELAALFERSLGDGSDVVQKEMLQLTSLGGERLATRPEGTASVIRALRQREGQPHGRVWYHGPMFRYERPQSGRYRQVNRACLSPHSLTLHALRSSISSGSSLLGATA